MSEPAKPAIKVRLYRRRNKLKDKTAGLGGSSPNNAQEILEINPEDLARAFALIEQAAEDYPDWVQSVIQRLYGLHKRALDDPMQRPAAFKEMVTIAHDLKGQGGTFGYPLVSIFATSLNRFVSLKTDIRDHHVEIVKAHIDAMRAVIRERVKGDGGDIGKALTVGLERVIAKFSEKIAWR
jgi:chemotaxis protein histidine kinase CheA